ncbi:MAG: hypothetical protein JW737_09195 [Acidobacteria bacterium]|nr:hypothetical protein [Acidobacteriota bacterium]
MAEYMQEPGKIKWFTVKIKTLFLWGTLVGILVIGGGIFYYVKFVLMSPQNLANKAIEKAKSEYSKLENHEKAIPELLEKPGSLLDEADELFNAQKYKESQRKAEESFLESNTEYERLVAAGAGYKSATFHSIEGVVQVRKKDRQDWIEAKERMPLYAGDYVKTGSNSGAVIILFDGSQYKIQESALILIEKSFEDPSTKRPEIAIKIDDGHVDVTTVDSEVPGSSTTVSTPEASTIFNEKADSAIEYDKQTGKSSIALYSGKATTKVGGETVRLTNNEKVNIKPGGGISQKIQLLQAPTLLAPPHREVYETDNPDNKVITFSWSDISGAEEYLIEVSTNQMFLKPLKTWTSKTSLSIKGFKLANYFWRVRASRTKRDDISNASQPLKFSLRKKSMVDIDDKTPPPIDIVRAYPLGEYFLISGKTEPGATLTVAVNNQGSQIWEVQSDGTFKDLVLLTKYGVNIVVFRSVDAAGNPTTKRIKLELK